MYAQIENLESAFERYHESIQRTIPIIGEQNNKLLSYAESILADGRHGRIQRTEVDFVSELDRIIKHWQDESPEHGTLSGNAINPFFLHNEVYTPLGNLYREHLALSRASEIMSIVRTFGLAYSERNSARELFRAELEAISRRMEEIRIVLSKYSEEIL